MMIRALPVLTLALLALGGCGREPHQASALPKDAPAWIGDPQAQGLHPLAVAGTAAWLKGMDAAMQEEDALLNAKKRLADQLANEVTTALSSLASRTRTADQVLAHETRTEAVQSSSSVTLVGLSQRARWVDPDTGTLYLWVVISPESARTIRNEAAERAAETVSKRAAVLNQVPTSERIQVVEDVRTIIRKGPAGR